MWCTRWFLPLLLLPIPTTSPYFLVLFLFALTMHARPCFYCIVMLSTLFVSSCYWQPFPLNSALSVPWSPEITTFSDALNVTMGPTYRKPLPAVVRAVDRCWCDFSGGSFFEPFNMSRWEHKSVERMKVDLEREQTDEEAERLAGTGAGGNASAAALTPPARASASVRKPGAWSVWRAIARASSASDSAPEAVRSVSTAKNASRTASDLPLVRQEYDLRPYGIDVVIDFRWSRETA